MNPLVMCSEFLHVSKFTKNVQFYANHPRLDELWNFTECVFKSKKSMFTVTVTDEAALFCDRKKGNRKEVLKREAEINCKPKVSSSFISRAALATVTRLKIYSCYPVGGNVGYVQLCNCELSPRTIVKNDKTIHMMWSREGSFDIRRGVIYLPNHFVPLFIVSNNYNKEEKSNSETVDPCVSSIKPEGHSKLKLSSVNPPKNPLKTPSNQLADMNVESKRKNTERGQTLYDRSEVDKFDIGPCYHRTEALSESELYELPSTLCNSPTFYFPRTVEAMGRKKRKICRSYLEDYKWLRYSKYLDRCFCLLFLAKKPVMIIIDCVNC